MNTTTLEIVKQQIAQRASFVLNIVADWCPDCTVKQAPHLPDFAAKLAQSDLPLLNLTVQKQKRVFLTDAHEAFVNSLGGHGFPRTVLFVEGLAVDTDNVEVIGSRELNHLAEQFIEITKKPA